MKVLGRKVVVVLLAIAGGIVLLAAGRAEWITGTVDGVAGPVRDSALGTEAAPGLAGLALVAMAAAIASTTSGRVARRTDSFMNSTALSPASTSTPAEAEVIGWTGGVGELIAAPSGKRSTGRASGVGAEPA